jgi:hypothetical protein
MGDVRLVAPRVLVVFTNGREPLEIQADNRDLVRWEKTRIRHKWPKFDEAPFQWLTFISWSAASRAGTETGTFETWENGVLSVRDMSSMEDAEDELGTPTGPGPEPG